jgi:hypothetical protein
LASGSIGFISVSAAIAALVGCSASNGSPSNSGNGGQTSNTGNGGQTSNTGNGGQTTTSGGSTQTGNGGTSSSMGGGTSTNGGSTNGGTTSSTNGGSTSSTNGGSAPAGGSGGGAAPVTCSNTDKTIIPIDKTLWVPKECNDYGIQGAWYCYTDGTTQAGCTDSKPIFQDGKVCLKGSTLGMSTTYGAAIGLSLNDSGMTEMMASVKSAYDATAHGVKGFAIGVSGDTGGLELRVTFTKLASPTGVSPFYSVPGAPATAPYNVNITDALVPKAWMVDNAGEIADPKSMYDLQIMIPGDSKAANFDFCITSLKPITDGTGPMTGGNLATYGSAQCGQYAQINVPNYVVQNNAYGGNQHCIQAKTDNATKAGFLLSNIQASKPTGGAPGSYPSIVYGWHVDGKFYGGYTTAKTLGSITSIPTNIAVTVPTSGRYNTSYDNWINSSASAGSSNGTLEQMIWMNYRDTTPIGSKVATANLANTTWDVWYGTHDGFRTVSYIRTNTNSMTFDINDFMKDTIQRGYAKTSDYLLGIQAGFEIWEGSGSGFSVDSFDVKVN